MALKIYNKKRDFKKTTEPEGKLSSHSRNLFVIQKHKARRLHYDLRLEIEGVLKSWAVPKGPCLDPTVKRLAVHVEDHPIAYGSFEGIIPKGQYGAGSVILWDKGKWEALDKNPIKSYHDGDLNFILRGKKLHGQWKLIRIRSDPNNWLLMKINDQFASKDLDITKIAPLSIISEKAIDEIDQNSASVWNSKASKKNLQGKTQKIIIENKEITREAMPDHISPELCVLVDKPPLGNDWLHEIKLDGYRLIAYIKNKAVKLITRGNQDWTEKFTNIAESLKGLKSQAIFDGEVVVLDNDYQSNFQLLQNAIKTKNSDFIFYVFDLIYFNNKNLSDLPLLQRKELLKAIIYKLDTSSIRFNDHVIGQGDEIYDKACHLGLEGIISKNIHSHYSEKRTHNWLKIKCSKRQEFIVGGYTAPKGSRKHFGSLLLGVYNDKNEFVYCGKVGTGFTDASLKTINSVLKKHHVSKSFFANHIPGKNQTWTKPVMVVEVEFSEWTQDGMLRHPSFKGIRKDKPPKKIIKEIIQPVSKVVKLKSANSIQPAEKKPNKDKFKLSHPEKVLYPEKGITKLQLSQYYYEIQNWILPYIIKRPLSILRCPEGIVDKKSCFYQKHIVKTPPAGIYTFPIEEKNGEIKQDIYIKNIKGLLALAQMGTLEIHPWGSKIKSPEKPDMIIFDLDPDPNLQWKKVVKAAFLIKEVLNSLHLISFIKSTGGKGLHVVTPIKPLYDWEIIKNFSHTLVKYFVMQNPKEYVGVMSKKQRTGKIYIDYLRNQRGATAIAPYSTRANQNATVAVPLHWDELTNKIIDTTFTIESTLKRLNSLNNDPWEGFFTTEQDLILST